jgi:hypothetical protein
LRTIARRASSDYPARIALDQMVQIGNGKQLVGQGCAIELRA